MVNSKVMYTRTKSFLSTSRLALLALAYVFTLTFAACGGEDDEPTIDELLSEETTPIDFELQDFEYYDRYFVFDYTGSRYVGADTITRSKCTMNLRQGKHHLIWMKGQYGSEVGFNPENRTFSGYSDFIDAAYTEMDIEVTPYLMPVQNVKCQKRTTIERSSLYIEVTDINGEMETPDGIKLGEKIKVTGFPFMNNISLDGNNYDTDNEINTGWVYFDDRGETAGIVLNTFCLTDRDNLQVKVETQDVRGNRISSTTLPSVSLKRECYTILRGPLFSGSTDDWTVMMEPY